MPGNTTVVAWGWRWAEHGREKLQMSTGLFGGVRVILIIIIVMMGFAGVHVKVIRFYTF